MSASFIEPAAFAVFVTLVHSLWQGALIFGITWLVLRFVPRMNAATRYAVWLLALLAIVVVPTATTTVQLRDQNAGLQQESPAPIRAPLQSRLVQANNTGAASVVAGRRATRAATVENQTASRAQAIPSFEPPQFFLPVDIAIWVGVAWLVGVFVQLLRLAASLVAIARIRRRAEILAKSGAISSEASINRGVYLSADVGIPMAVGLRTPSILIPKTLVENLSPEDLKRVVRHEHAHIRRNDIRVNALQRVIEALPFFNPFVHLVGRELAAEREVACDDWVVAEEGDVNACASCLAKVAQAAGCARSLLAAPSILGSRQTGLTYFMV